MSEPETQGIGHPAARRPSPKEHLSSEDSPRLLAILAMSGLLFVPILLLCRPTQHAGECQYRNGSKHPSERGIHSFEMAPK